MSGQPKRAYPLHDQAPPSPPDYARVARGLTDADLEDEILAGLGEPAYQLALLREHDRRGKEDA